MHVPQQHNGFGGAKSAAGESTDLSPARKNRRVLIIDDNRAIHDDFRKILAPETKLSAVLEATEAALFGSPTNAVQEIQFEVDSAYQGQEGALLVKRAREGGLPYAMAFVDMRMPPGWDGLETTQKILEIDPDIQIVICTAYSDYSWGDMFEKLGQRDGLLILKKPFDTVEAFQLAYSLTEKWWLHQQSRRKMEELESMVAKRTSELGLTNHALQTEVVKHQRAEETLRQSNEKFHQLADNITDAFWIRSPNMLEVHYISPAFERIWGRSVASLYADPQAWADFILPEDRERVLDGFAALTMDAPGLDIEYRIVRLDGEIRWVRVRGFQVRDAAEKLIRHTGIVTDITESKSAQDALQERARLAVLEAEVGTALTRGGTLAEMLRLCSEAIVRQLDAAFARIWTLNEGEKMLELQASAGLYTHLNGPHGRVPVGKFKIGLIAEERKPHLTNQVVGDPRVGDQEWARREGMVAFAGYPLLVENRLVGVVAMFASHPITDTTLKALASVSNNIAMGIERKLAAEELRESERRFSDMLCNLDLVSMMVDRDARITYCNDYLLQLTGWKREEVLGRNSFDLFVPPELFNELQRVHSALLDDQPAAWHYENEILTRAGARRLIRWNNSVLRSASGNVIGTASIGEDITERRQAEAALQSSEARNHAIVHSSLDCIVSIDHEGRILEFNPAAEKVFGYARTEVLGKEMAQVIVPPSLRERHRQGMIHYLATGEARVIGKRIEIIAMRSDGSEFPIDLAITRMGKEMPPMFTASIRDITDRKQAELQSNLEHALSRILAESSTLKQASARILQTLCENLHWDLGALWSVDRNAEVMRNIEIWTAPNIPADELARLSRGTEFVPGVGLPGRVWATGKPAWIPDVLVDSNFPRVAATQKAGLHSAFCFPFLAGNEVVGVLEFFNRQIREPDDRLLRMFAALGSQLGQFFERKRLEEQLFQSQKLETVGKLAGGIAHEFNNIMTAIMGQSELLLNALPSSSPLGKGALEIRKSADRAAVLTRQLLAYGRKQLLHPQILDLNSVLAGMETVLRHLMGRDVQVRIVPALGLKPVKADAGQIEQVIVNMAMNAADVMPGGGKLTLETANVSLDWDYLSRFPELKAGQYAMLAITDTGSGMSDEVKARIFEPFFTTKGVGKGTGLGLATCHGIIKQSGGHLTVGSEPGRGATFKIYLPQLEPLAKASPPPLESSGLPHGTETILLVENNPDLRAMASTLLRHLDYTVFTAKNGVEALTLANQQSTGHVDLLFTDVVMPHMSGGELGDRASALFSRTKILFSSAHTEGAGARQGALNPEVELLQKPFTPSALAQKVREVLNAKTIHQ